MEFRKVWVLRGRNYWTPSPALELELTVSPGESVVPGLGRRLLTLAGPTADTGCRERLAGVESIPEAVLEVTRHLQTVAGSPVSFGHVKTVRPGEFYRVVVEYEEEAIARACLGLAGELCRAAVSGSPFDLAAKLPDLIEMAGDTRLGPSTGAIVRAALKRNIPYRRLNDGSLVQLGQGARQRRILTAETDRTGAIAETIAQDKQLTRSLLAAVGVPVPQGRVVKDAEDAWAAAEDIGLPVVVKPQFGNHGRGVATNLTTREQVVRAYAAAREEDRHVMVETFIPGADHRILVIGTKVVAAARREPAHVIGDGLSTIRRLIEEVNKDPRRSDGHSTVLSYIKLDPVADGVLQEQGFTADSVPAAGQRVLIRRNGNLSTGGTATDVTDQLHPDVAARMVEAARVVGLDIAGVDLVALDVSRPLHEQRGAVVEVNAGPGLRMHLQPSEGTPRPVGEAIIDMLFPDGVTGRIPTVAVTGVNGKTTTTRLIAHLLRSSGLVTGMTCTDGAYVDGRQIRKEDCSGPRTARAIFVNPAVEAAVLETARGGILREGLGFDHCDVAVVTNIGTGDHFGLHGIDTLQELCNVKRVVVEAVAPTGAAVLNAADPLVADMAPHCPGRVVFFAAGRGQPVLIRHRAAGGRAVFVENGSVILADGDNEQPLISLDRVPLTHHGTVPFQIDNVLAAAGAAWSLGLDPAAVRRGFETFAGTDLELPARFNVHRTRDATVIVDYAHNPSALVALINSLPAFPARRRSIVFSPANRRDTDILEMGDLLAGAFDDILLYRDTGNSDRADGEMTALIRQALARATRPISVREFPDEPQAIDHGFRSLAAGDLLVIGVEAIEDALTRVQAHLARDERPPNSA